MLRRIPVLATLIVVAASATMVALGIWQLGRAQEKETLMARYMQRAQSDEIVEWPGDGPDYETQLYARSRLTCESAQAFSSSAGRSARGEPGLAVTAICTAQGGIAVPIVLGWTRDVAIPQWNGGEVEGIIAPGPRLVLDPPQAGLEANAKPDPRDLPNNHLAYAGQWFLFALTALVIYGLALRRRWKEARQDEG